MNIQRCYEILEIDAHATPDEMKRAYKDIVNVWHPDRFPNNPRLRSKAEKKIKDINDAYETLQVFRSRSENRKARFEDDQKQGHGEPGHGGQKPESRHVEALFEVGTGLVLNFWAFMSGKVQRVMHQIDRKDEKNG